MGRGGGGSHHSGGFSHGGSRGFSSHHSSGGSFHGSGSPGRSRGPSRVAFGGPPKMGPSMGSFGSQARKGPANGNGPSGGRIPPETPLGGPPKRKNSAKVSAAIPAFHVGKDAASQDNGNPPRNKWPDSGGCGGPGRHPSGHAVHPAAEAHPVHPLEIIQPDNPPRHDTSIRRSGPAQAHLPLPPVAGNNMAVFVSSQSRSGSGLNPGGSGRPRDNKKGNGAVPTWFKWLSALLIILSAILVMASCSIRNAATGLKTREKLGSTACVSSGEWMDDRLGWISDEQTVKEGMEYFYNKTGVQPYLLICDNIDGLGGDASDSDMEDAMDTLYSGLYDDEGHMIFLFMEYAESEYATYVYTGVSADTVIDSDARNIILNYADRYYTDNSLSDEEYFAKVFEKSADKIMEDHSSDAKAGEKYMFLSILLDAFVVGSLIALHIRKKRKEELEQVQEILNTPIGASPEEKDLEEKYGDKGNV